MTTMTYTSRLVVTSCWCGIPFAIPEELHTWMCKSSDNACRCPNGHTMVFSDGIEQQLAQAKRQLSATRELLAQEERSHSATKGQVTKVKKKLARVEAGVCPHCNRTFQNLARHMETKHSHA